MVDLDFLREANRIISCRRSPETVVLRLNYLAEGNVSHESSTKKIAMSHLCFDEESNIRGIE